MLIQLSVIEVSAVPNPKAAITACHTVRARTVVTASHDTPSRGAGQKLTGANPAAVAAPAAPARTADQPSPGHGPPAPSMGAAWKDRPDFEGSGRRARRLASGNSSRSG